MDGHLPEKAIVKVIKNKWDKKEIKKTEKYRKTTGTKDTYWKERARLREVVKRQEGERWSEKEGAHNYSLCLAAIFICDNVPQ